MDGVHDLGGMSGFGPVVVEPGEPVFHERWEAQTFAMNALSLSVLRAFNADEYRHAVERIEPAHYLAAPYYERMLTGVATLLVEKGVVTRADLEARAGAPFPLARRAAAVRTADLPQARVARFAVGDTVVVRDIHPAGHTRVPRYVRGREGVVIHVAPAFSFPDAAAHGLPQREEHTYHVRFAATALWSDAAEVNAFVVVDLWESYLERRAV